MLLVKRSLAQMENLVTKTFQVLAATAARILNTEAKTSKKSNTFKSYFFLMIRSEYRLDNVFVQEVL